jgi:folate-binding protein YgfZ
MTKFDGYHAVASGVALADRSGRIRLEVAGVDRAKFLHNLTTNEIKRMPVGRGCESFVTSLQGKTLGPESIMALTDPGGLALALPHFQKYGVFDEIVLEDRSETTFEFHLVGPKADEIVRNAGGELPEPENLAHRITELAGIEVLILREAPTGRPGLTLIGARSNANKVAGMLREHGKTSGLVDLTPETFEVLRIEAGTPVFGREVTEKNLPQEFGRDDAAISFVKGCYLGQETVARIDALGHVNQILKGIIFKFDASCPATGSELEGDGRRVGMITSSVFSPGWNAPIALALVRTTHAQAGTELQIKNHDGSITATVSDLPMLPKG